MKVRRAGSQPAGKGPADWFTGTVRIDPPFRSSLRRARRKFDPGKVFNLTLPERGARHAPIR